MKLRLFLAGCLLISLPLSAANRNTLINAVKKGNLEKVKELLHDTEIQVHINLKDKYGQTALYNAARIGNLAIVKALHKKGADLNIGETDRWTPLHSAINNNHFSVVQYLVKSGADINRQEITGKTPIYFAVLHGRYKAAQLLIKAGADINKQENDGWSPLHSAAYNNRLRFVELLFEARAKTELKNKYNNTAFNLARLQKNEEIISLFMKTGKVKSKTFSFKRTYELKNTSKKDIRVQFTVPGLPPFSNLKSSRTSHSIYPEKIQKEANGNKTLLFTIDLSGGEKKDLTLHWIVELSYSSQLAEKERSKLKDSLKIKYLSAENDIESDHSEIRAKAKSLTGGTRDNLEKLKKIVTFVRSHIKYDRQGIDSTTGALAALRTGNGDCTEFSILSVALARAAGIPARAVGVMNMYNAPGSAAYDNHNTAEFYINGKWIFTDVNISGNIGEVREHILVLRRGLFTDNVPWYEWRTLQGPRGKLKVTDMNHSWEEAEK